MMTETAALNEEKTAGVRLLDLLAGWSAFVSEDEQNNLRDPVLSAEEIAELYQEAGERTTEWSALPLEEQEREVRAFIDRRITPLIVRRPAAPREQSQAA
jgi:hypothetical protein